MRLSSKRRIAGGKGMGKGEVLGSSIDVRSGEQLAGVISRRPGSPSGGWPRMRRS